jgi:hypothetical protein
MLHHRIYKAMGAMAISEVKLLILFCCFCSPIFGGKSQEPLSSCFSLDPCGLFG